MLWIWIQPPDRQQRSSSDFIKHQISLRSPETFLTQLHERLSEDVIRKHQEVKSASSTASSEPLSWTAACYLLILIKKKWSYGHKSYYQWWRSVLPWYWLVALFVLFLSVCPPRLTVLLWTQTQGQKYYLFRYCLFWFIQQRPENLIHNILSITQSSGRRLTEIWVVMKSDWRSRGCNFIKPLSIHQEHKVNLKSRIWNWISYFTFNIISKCFFHIYYYLSSCDVTAPP